MDPSYYVGKLAVCRQCLCDANVRPDELETAIWATRSATNETGGITLTTAYRATTLAKALQKGDSALADKVLRSWGIRR